MHDEQSRTRTSNLTLPAYSRRSLLRAGAGVAGAALVAGRPHFAGAQGATPAAIEGRIVSQVSGVPDAFTTLPAPYPAYDGTPANGGKITAFVVTYDPPLPGHDDNQYWQELEKRLGVESYEPVFAPRPNYEERLAATMAGGDLPDFVFLTPPSSIIETILQGAFADLTPHLTGENLKKYPNLAAFPAQTWENVKINGKIYGVPRPRFLGNDVMIWRQDWADGLGTPAPENADALFSVMEAMTKNDPDGNGNADTYGMMGAPDSGTLGDFLIQVFGAPNGWRVNDDGTMTSAVETEEYRLAVEFARKLWEAGIFHPDSLTLTSAQGTDLFNAGTVGSTTIGIINFLGSQGRRSQIQDFNPDALVTGVVPMGHDGGPGTYHQSRGFFGFTSIAASSAQDDARLEELLRILDYLAAPFGSEQWLFNSYGLEGVHHTIDDNGTIQLTETGRQEIGVLSGPQGILAGLTNPPPVAFYDVPGQAEYMQQYQEQLMAIGIPNPTQPLYSPTDVESGGQIGQLVDDTLIAVVTGRDDMSAWDQMLNDWRSRGGDQIRQEFQEALANQG